MPGNTMRKALSFICTICLLSLSAQAQSVLQGRILGRDSLPLAGVSIRNINTKSITISNRDGLYTITANNNDTILFRAIGYIPLAMRAMIIPRPLYLRSQVIDLQGVEIVKRNYLKDSLERREAYKKGFNFRRPKVQEVVKIGFPYIAVNIHQLYKALSFKSNKKADVFKERLINFERDQYVDQRFTPELVANLTGLDGDSLQHFINRNRPSYEFAVSASQYDLLLFIKQAVEKYRRTPDTTSAGK